MFKKVCQINYLIFFLFSILNYSNSLADIDPYCNNKITQDHLKKIKITQPQFIEIEINNYRKWQKNNFGIITSNAGLILPKYKKKFKGAVHVYFTDKIKCSFSAQIRQNGDWLDHIEFIEGNFFQSLDIHLITGHINGITKFKLFIPKTRNFPNDEIIVTELLRELGFLAPRTYYTKVKLNERTSTMLFQEKTEKEMLEHNGRREGPILEGNERYMWSFKNNNLNYKSELIQLSKQKNVNWAMKGDQYQNISQKALSELNRIYLRYIDQIQYNFYYNFSHYNLDNYLLASNNQEQILELEIYNAMIFSISRGHALRPHNRQFYWNAIKDYFEPIYYDGDVNIDNTYPHMAIPHTFYSLKAIEETKKRIKEINIENLFNKIKLNRSTISMATLKKKIENIILNLNNLHSMQKIFITNKNQGLKPVYFFKLNDGYKFSDPLVEKKFMKIYRKNNNKFFVNLKEPNSPLTDNIWRNFFNSSKYVGSDFNFIFRDPLNKSYTSCNVSLNCKRIDLKNDEIKNLLRGKLDKNNNPYEYIGEYSKIDNKLIPSELKKIKSPKYNKVKFKNSNFYYDEKIKFEFDEKNSIFNIYQKYSGARAYFMGGKLKNISINFHSLPIAKSENLINYPFNENGLTGCLSFIGLNFQNVNISSFNSNCEDSINLINTKGHIKKIISNNSIKDGLDIDFSNVKIDAVNIEEANNDCIDVSGGEYNLNNIYLNKCGDKGLSVGEKSFVNLKNLEISKSNIGVSSKDSSVTNIENMLIKSSTICLEAKRKKQEFSGGIINIKDYNCNNASIQKNLGSFINYN